MTIFVEPYGTAPEVMLGFTNRLRFRFSPHHDRDNTVTYELLGPYHIDVYVERPQIGNVFIGRGHLLLLDSNNLIPWNHLNNVVGSLSAGQIAVWEVQIELSRETVAEIDAARRPLGDAPVRFIFEWLECVSDEGTDSRKNTLQTGCLLSLPAGSIGQNAKGEPGGNSRQRGRQDPIGGTLTRQ